MLSLSIITTIVFVGINIEVLDNSQIKVLSQKVAFRA